MKCGTLIIFTRVLPYHFQARSSKLANVIATHSLQHARHLLEGRLNRVLKKGRLNEAGKTNGWIWCDFLLRERRVGVPQSAVTGRGETVFFFLFVGFCTTRTRRSIMWVSSRPPAKRQYATAVSGESDKLFLYELNIQNAINPVTLRRTKPWVLITELWVMMSRKACGSSYPGYTGGAPPSGWSLTNYYSAMLSNGKWTAFI